jgi:ParB family transcriptional regulator, chromosome partitioning protein
MSERKSRFGDPSAMPDDPALRVLALRPQNVVTQPKAARTWPGRLAEEDSVGLQNHLTKERAERAAERNAGMVLVKLDPDSIGITKFANRHELSLSNEDESFQGLKASIKTRGQDTPVRVRPAPAGSTQGYELVEGHRRHAAILQLNREIEGGFPILARIDAKCAEAIDLVQKMYRENAEREDLSPYETGCQFANWLDVGLCKGQADVAKLTDLSQGTVSRYLTIGTLPAEIVDAFGDPRRIVLRWADSLAKALKESKAECLARARRLSQREQRPDADQVFRELTSALGAAKSKHAKDKKSHTVMHNGKTLYAYSVKRGSLSFTRFKVPDDLVDEMTSHMSTAFEAWLRSLEKRQK